MNHYPTDLTDNRWQVIEKFLDVQVRKRKYSLRSIVNEIIADGGYRGKLWADTLKATLGCELEVVLRPDECPSKFQVMPKRWIVEKIIKKIRDSFLNPVFYIYTKLWIVPGLLMGFSWH